MNWPTITDIKKVYKKPHKTIVRSMTTNVHMFMYIHMYTTYHFTSVYMSMFVDRRAYGRPKALLQLVMFIIVREFQLQVLLD